MAKSTKKTTKRRKTLKNLSVKLRDLPAKGAVRIKGGRAVRITLT